MIRLVARGLVVLVGITLFIESVAGRQPVTAPDKISVRDKKDGSIKNYEGTLVFAPAGLQIVGPDKKTLAVVSPSDVVKVVPGEMAGVDRGEVLRLVGLEDKKTKADYAAARLGYVDLKKKAGGRPRGVEEVPRLQALAHGQPHRRRDRLRRGLVEGRGRGRRQLDRVRQRLQDRVRGMVRDPVRGPDLRRDEQVQRRGPDLEADDQKGLGAPGRPPPGGPNAGDRRANPDPDRGRRGAGRRGRPAQDRPGRCGQGEVGGLRGGREGRSPAATRSPG
jgi:hypothetical protein